MLPFTWHHNIKDNCERAIVCTVTSVALVENESKTTWWISCPACGNSRQFNSDPRRFANTIDRASPPKPAPKKRGKNKTPLLPMFAVEQEAEDAQRVAEARMVKERKKGRQ